MSTGMVESWTGNILDIGPIYPFVGSEMLLWIIGMILWIGWHVWQVGNESKEYAEEAEKYTQGEKLLKAIRGERVS
jgi:hypothetical protein